jgi:hypothetical protein
MAEFAKRGEHDRGDCCCFQLASENREEGKAEVRKTFSSGINLEFCVFSRQSARTPHILIMLISASTSRQHFFSVKTHFLLSFWMAGKTPVKMMSHPANQN